MKRGGQLKKQTNKCNVKKHNHLVKLYGCIYSPTNANILWIRQSQSIGMPHVSRWWQPPLDDCSGHGYYCLVVQWCLLPSCSGGPLEDSKASVNIEWQSYESNPRRYADLLTSARATSHQPLFYSAYRTPRSLIRSLHGAEASANLSSTTALPQVLDLDGTSRFNVHRPLSPIRSRESFSAVESYDSSPILNPPEESTSPSAPSHDEENLLNSQSSFISLDSTNPILFQSDFTACLYMAGIQHDQLSLALLAMSDLHNQNNAVSNITPSHSPSHSKEIKKPSTDPENILYFFICVFSLLEEDSEEEGDQCRICQIAGGSITNPLLEPCSCVGSLQYVHQECLKSWLKAKIKSGADLETIKNCELCKQSLVVELGDFNVSDYYRNHQQSQVRNAGLVQEQLWCFLHPGQSKTAAVTGGPPLPRPRGNTCWRGGGGIE
uniref:RING-type E3 ubiquitin transferase n=1 Tax=Crocodylus porosus TaxID=8502 RepID=A0A7M4EM09_CROPO